VEEKYMKRFLGMMFVCTLLAIPSFAAKNSQTVTIPAAVQVGSTTLPAGDYKVTWTGSGATAQVTLAKKGATPVTVPAQVVEQKNNHSGVSINTESGKGVLKAIFLNNINLVF
jgi:hypothetical protein